MTITLNGMNLIMTLAKVKQLHRQDTNASIVDECSIANVHYDVIVTFIYPMKRHLNAEGVQKYLLEQLI